MRPINVGIIGTGWCGGIRAETCAINPAVKDLHIVETRAERREESEPEAAARMTHGESIREDGWRGNLGAGRREGSRGGGRGRCQFSPRQASRPWASTRRASVSSQPMHPSVMDTPYANRVRSGCAGWLPGLMLLSSIMPTIDRSPAIRCSSTSLQTTACRR